MPMNIDRPPNTERPDRPLFVGSVIIEKNQFWNTCLTHEFAYIGRKHQYTAPCTGTTSGLYWCYKSLVLILQAPCTDATKYLVLTLQAACTVNTMCLQCCILRLVDSCRCKNSPFVDKKNPYVGCRLSWPFPWFKQGLLQTIFGRMILACQILTITNNKNTAGQPTFSTIAFTLLYMQSAKSGLPSTSMS